MRDKVGRERSCACGDYVIVRQGLSVVVMLHWSNDQWQLYRKGFTRAVAWQHGFDPDAIEYVFEGVRRNKENDDDQVD